MTVPVKFPTNEAGELIPRVECRSCGTKYSGLTQHWGVIYGGVCLKCQRKSKTHSRNEAKWWRYSTLERCKYSCEVCDTYAPHIMHIHHVRPVAHNGDGSPDNLIALCPNCHAYVHALKQPKRRTRFDQNIPDIHEHLSALPYYKFLNAIASETAVYRDEKWQVEE